jgi:hypothetical protein
MYAHVRHILPLTLIRKQRILPVPGRVLARQGQKVGAMDVIAEAQVAPEHILLNLSRSLRVSPEVADEITQCQTGDNVNIGDLIAGPIGIPRRVVRAPVDGKVQLVGEGQVLIQIDKPAFELISGVRGTVTQLIPDFGAIIETHGALIQGVWGNGLEDYGLMQVKIEMPNDILTHSQINLSLRGSIIMGGHCNDKEILLKAADIPVRGLILTSMSSNLISTAKKMNYPILILEGFGRIPLNEIAFDLLTTHQNREISLNAEIFNRYEGKHPEIIITLPTEENLELPANPDNFAEGQKVRINSRPYHAKTGTIEILYNNPVTFPSGIRTNAAKISLDKGASVEVPLANLEIIA